MSKILIKDNESYFIDSIYDLHQVVDEDTYDLILGLLEDEKEEQCERCSYCDADDLYDYEEEYDECRSVLEETYDLLKDILEIKSLEDGMKENMQKVINNVKWALR